MLIGIVPRKRVEIYVYSKAKYGYFEVPKSLDICVEQTVYLKFHD
jgi:hypothetical protein